MVRLEALPESPDLWEGIEEEIIRVFHRELYQPLIEEFGTKTLRNARDVLIDALFSGRITFNMGIFSGRFNATITKKLKALGAKWDRKGECFRISKSELPPEIQYAISASKFAFESKLGRIDEKLERISPEELAGLIHTEKYFDKSIYEMDSRVRRSMKKASKKLYVPPQMSKEVRKKISDEWQNNMRLWITDFTKREVKDLRTRMLGSAMRGNRYESAISTIQRSYDVTRNKAKFLASQETRLLLCKFKAARYQESGVRYYKWKSVTGTAKHPVRPRHAELNRESEKGKIFRFDQPPVSTGAGEPARRNNPGEDYNCRCVAIPIVDFTK